MTLHIFNSKFSPRAIQPTNFLVIFHPWANNELQLQDYPHTFSTRISCPRITSRKRRFIVFYTHQRGFWTLKPK